MRELNKSDFDKIVLSCIESFEPRIKRIFIEASPEKYEHIKKSVDRIMVDGIMVDGIKYGKFEMDLVKEEHNFFIFTIFGTEFLIIKQ